MLGVQHINSGHTAPVGWMGMFSALSPLCCRSMHIANLVGGCAVEKPY